MLPCAVDVLGVGCVCGSVTYCLFPFCIVFFGEVIVSYEYGEKQNIDWKRRIVSVYCDLRVYWQVRFLLLCRIVNASVFPRLVCLGTQVGVCGSGCFEGA